MKYIRHIPHLNTPINDEHCKIVHLRIRRPIINIFNQNTPTLCETRKHFKPTFKQLENSFKALH